MPPLSRPILAATLAISALVGVSALALAVMAFALPAKPVYGLAGFEVVSLVAAVLGFLIGRGRFATAPGLALACVGGTILVAGGLAYVSLAEGRFEGYSMKSWVLGRALAGATLMGLGALAVICRNPAARPPLIRGVLLGLPALAVAGLWVSGRQAAVTGPLSNLPGIVSGLLVIIVGLIVGGMACAAIHYVITAFEMCRVPGVAPTASSAAKEIAREPQISA